MPKYKVTSNIKHNGDLYEVGSEIELNENEATQLAASLEMPEKVEEVENEVEDAPKAGRNRGKQSKKVTGKEARPEEAPVEPESQE